MVRSISRSKGCSLCLRRKIKCDEKQPQCSQCQRVRRKCPGALTGTIFINATIPNGSPLDVPDASDSCSQSSTPPLAHQDPCQLHISKSLAIYQPSVAPIFDQQFLTIFVSSFTKPNVNSTPHQSWMQCLHGLEQMGDDPMRCSIRATTLAFCGQEANNLAMQKTAEWWHIAALQSQQAKLSQRLQHDTLIAYKPSEQEILTSMMLLYFELISPSSTASWLKHLNGVAILLQLRGPERCQSGPIHLLFRSLRLLMVYCSLRSGNPSIFASRPWQTVPFAQSGKTDIDKLVDILLLASNLLTSIGNKHKISEEKVWPTGPSLHASLSEILARMTLHEKQNQQTTCCAENKQMASIQAPEAPSDKLWAHGSGDFSTPTPESLFHSARILLDNLTVEEDSETQDAVTKQPDCSLSVPDLPLADASPPNSGSCVQLALYLEIVQSFSLSPSCRHKAQMYLKQLGWEQVHEMT